MNRYVSICYPQSSYVTFAKIEMWYKDALANKELAEEWIWTVHDATSDKERRRAMCLALHDCGHITLRIGWDREL